jgi:hypothetical protein
MEKGFLEADPAFFYYFQDIRVPAIFPVFPDTTVYPYSYFI